MRKLLTSFIVLAMFIGAGAAFADDTTALTTKNYVDSGLRAVYNVAADAQERVGTLTTTVNNINTTVNGHTTDITNLQNTVGDENSGLVQQVNTNIENIESLQDQIDALEAASSDTTYSAGTGITISGQNNAVSVTGLDTTTESGNTTKRYVYQNGVLTELEVANTWNADILTSGNN